MSDDQVTIAVGSSLNSDMIYQHNRHTPETMFNVLEITFLFSYQ